jgi:hypothetical protein
MDSLDPLSPIRYDPGRETIVAFTAETPLLLYRVELDLLLVAEGSRPVAHVRHRAIYRVHAPEAAPR